jgi:RNA-directed DNA polymerase
MSFQGRLQTAIEEEAVKLISRHQRYAKGVHDEIIRIERRSGVRHPKRLLHPQYWTVSPGFDPYHVRSNAGIYAHAIEKKLRRGHYRPRPAVSYEVPKPDGTMRSISVFQVADNALSRLIYKDLMAKNAPRFSARCYAYRTDVTLHDAVQHISAQFRRDVRLYIAEFDYSKFFASLSHDFLDSTMSEQRFLHTKREKAILSAFLKTPTHSAEAYTVDEVSERQQGIPEGTSISLFLANAAGSSLDESLERIGVGFARYADDTLVWSTEYASVCRAAEALSAVGHTLGARINLAKSYGISVLVRDGERAEMASKATVKFIGYSLSRSRISMARPNVQKAKERISAIIYRNLLKPVQDGNLQSARLDGTFDRDYYVMILQLRRYLYGGMSESQLRSFTSRATARIRFKGLMSFYPIIDDEAQLQQLDGWMLHTVFTTLRKRREYLCANGIPASTPMSISRDTELLNAMAEYDGRPVDLRLPSFLRMSRLVQRMAKVFGANQVANRRAPPYYEG